MQQKALQAEKLVQDRAAQELSLSSRENSKLAQELAAVKHKADLAEQLLLERKQQDLHAKEMQLAELLAAEKQRQALSQAQSKNSAAAQGALEAGARRTQELKEKYAREKEKSRSQQAELEKQVKKKEVKQLQFSHVSC